MVRKKRTLIARLLDRFIALLTTFYRVYLDRSFNATRTRKGNTYFVFPLDYTFGVTRGDYYLVRGMESYGVRRAFYDVPMMSEDAVVIRCCCKDDILIAVVAPRILCNPLQRLFVMNWLREAVDLVAAAGTAEDIASEKLKSQKVLDTGPLDWLGKITICGAYSMNPQSYAGCVTLRDSFVG
jgi:hypothetical protein